MKITKRVRDEYEALLNSVGEEGLYSHFVKTGNLARDQFEYPENMLIDQSDAFFILYRTTGNNNYFVIGKILRRSSHTLYREAKRKNPDYPVNQKFLASIK